MAGETTRGSGQVRSLTRALSILRALAANNDGMSLTELSDATGLPPSTTHRLLTTLEAERFARTDAATGHWRVGVAAFYVGATFARSRDLLALIRPFLRRLMEMSGETANLFVESDGEAICIGQVESRHAMRAITGVGGRIRLHSAAAGKVLLAHMPRRMREEFLATAPFQRITGKTIVDRAALEAELEHIRARGHGIDDEEHAIGLRCVAAPIFNEFDEIVAAISVSGPTARIPDQRFSALEEMVGRAAGEATRDFGGTPGPAASM